MSARSRQAPRAAGARLAALLLLAPACSDSSRVPGQMVDHTEAAGIEFTHDNGWRGPYYFPETVGAGVALLDLENDGDLDVYAVQSGIVPGSLAAAGEHDYAPTNRLYANRGDGTFDDVTATSGDAAHAGYGMGVCGGDVDGDGLLDLFVTNTGPDALLLNRGGLAFHDAAAGTPLADPRWTTGCGFADVDQDGNLDLVVCGYVEWSAETEVECNAGGVDDYCHVSIYQGIADRLWRGDGLGGFVDATQTTDFGGRTGRGLGLALVDLDQDGDTDLYVANDTVENHVYLGEGGELRDRTDVSGAAYNLDGMAEAGMGVASGDFDGDALPDLLVTNFAGESNTVYLNLGQGRFRDASRQTGITVASRAALGFGTVLADFDRDGVMDLVVTNGHVMRNAGREGSPWRFRQPDQLFRGIREGGSVRFEPWEGAGELFDVPRVGRAVATGDLDGDGQLDLVFLGSGERLVVAMNGLARPDTHALRVRLHGRGTNTWAVGAHVALALDDGTVLHRWVRSGTGFLSQDDLAPTFGIPAGRSVEELRVRWPDGSASTHEVEGLDRTVEVRQPDA